jgi:Thyroglobulin type-1 repeat/Antistasin family
MPAKQKYIAQCNDDGSWKTIQCGPGACWCVDDRGNEKSGTRTNDKVPNCSVSKENCPQPKCKACEHGYEFDDNGCKTCQCKDLCKDIKCPLDEQCELVQVECISSNNNTQPCPRMPICTPIRDSICTEGLPLKQNAREINCGPEADVCPTTHSCNLNPITKRGVCCAKSRDVCFESIDSICTLSEEDAGESVVKYRFNPRVNKCTPVRLSKTKNSSCISKNLFHNEKACRSVCPVLSQCERLRLKNSIAARRRADKSDIWFKPICDPENGHWSAVQCIGENTNDNTRVCWCADKKGSPIKGSLTKGSEPTCNHRQARRRMQVDEADPMMEELIRQITFLTDENNFLDEEETKNEQMVAVTERIFEISELSGESSKKLIASTTRCDALRSTAHFDVNCDEGGNFYPTQCNYETCWCVDEAGNQLPWSSTFRKSSKKCQNTPLDAVEVELHLTNPNEVKLRNLYDVLVEDLKNLVGEGFVNFRVQENSDGSVTMKFDLIDDKKVNQAFAIEEMSKEQNLFLFHGMLKTDVTQSKFSHRVPMTNLTDAQKASLGIPQNTFHTIVFIMATSSAFIISILVIYVMLKKGKTKDKSHYVNNKNIHSGDKYVDYTSPIFVLSANDVRTSSNSS